MQNTLTHQRISNKKNLLVVCLLLAFCFLTGNMAMAQDKTVKGKVTAADGSGIPGVNIIVKGTNKGTNSDASGDFSISAPENATLVFSFVGYTTQEMSIGNQSEINITLAEDAKQLNEVVITALGIKKDIRTIGYAIQEVKGEDLIKAREPNAINSLAGKVAGLTIGASPELLRKPNINLRGNSDVLYVVDGVPINSDTWNISPDDIESYSVLKGPNASALYGFRGINGAILITTKKGSKDKRGFSVDFNSSTMFDRGFNAIPKVQDEYGPGDHGVYGYVDGRGGGLNDADYDIWGPRFEGQLIPQYDSPVSTTQTFTTSFPNGSKLTGNLQPTPWTARGKDNLSRFIETGILSTNNVSVSSSTEKADLRFSVSHSYQKGIVPNTKLNITNFNASIGLNFSPKLRFESNINYNKQYTPNFPDVNYGPNSMIYNITIWGGADWNLDDFNPDKGGSYWQPGKEGVQQIYPDYARYNNPYFLANEWLRGHYKTDIYGYTSLRYKFADFLEATLRTQVTTWDLLRTEKFPYSATVYGREEARGDYREDRRSLFENNTDILVKFDKNVIPDLSVKAWVGANLRTFNFNSNYISTNYLNVPASSLNPSGYSFGNSRNPLLAYDYEGKMQVGSFYYSVDLAYKNFISLSTTGRMDKLSTLPTQNNTYFYPSVSLSTVISDYVTIPNPISFLKVRASYANVKEGLTQSTIGPAGFPLGYGDAYRSSYDGPSYRNSAVYSTPLVYNNQPAAYFTNTLNNPDLLPKTNSSYEAGLDIRFLQNRIGLDVTHYISDLGPDIFNLPLSEGTGYNSALKNGIKTRRKGWEVSVTGSPIKNPEGFNWDILANWSTYRETLREVFDGRQEIASNYFVSGSSGIRVIKVGERVDQYYDAGYLKTPDGQFINDAGGRPIRNAVAQFMGFVDPDWVWAINNRFRYKGVTLSFQFDGRVGGVIANYIQRQTFRGGRHIETTQGAMGVARANDVNNIKSYVGGGVVISNGIAPKFDALGNITNYNELQYAPNTTATFLQDYISRYYQDAENNLMKKTFGKLREVTVGYSLPTAWLGKAFIRQASISFVARNLLYFAEKKDVDLDQYTYRVGYTGIETPTTRRFGFNLNLTF